MTLQFWPVVADLPKVFEDSKRLITISQQQIELHKIILKSLSFFILFFILITKSFEDRISEINAITSHQQFLQLEVEREVIFDVIIKSLLVKVEELKTSH